LNKIQRQRWQTLLELCAPSTPRSVAVEADWSDLRELATAHGVAPLLASRLATAPAALRLVTRLRNQYLVEELFRLLDACASAAINALVLKGPVLAKLAYRDLSCRAFCDLDVLILEDDLPRAVALLERRGYRANLPRKTAMRRRFQAVATNLRSANGLVNVDLHWDLSPAYYHFGPEAGGVWRRAVALDLEGRPVPTLAQLDQLLFLVVHASRHGWATLGHLCDLAYLVHGSDFAWDEVLRAAAQSRCLTILNVGLLLANRLLKLALPAAVIGQARRDRRAARLAEGIAGGFAGERSSAASTQLVRRALAAIERPRDRLRYLVIRGFAPTLADWSERPLSQAWYPIYYGLRPWRILRAALAGQR